MNLDDMLSKTADEVEAPKPLPAGHYEGTIIGYKFDKSKNTQTDYVEYTVRLEAPGQDVDKELLLASGASLPKDIRASFYITEGSLFILKNLLTHGLRIPGAGSRPLKELIPEAVNRRCLWKMKHTTSTRNGEQVTSAVYDGFAPNVD